MASTTAVAPSAGSACQPRFDPAAVVTIAAGHLFHDTFSAFLIPLLPLLITKLSLSLTVAGTLTLFSGLPSLFQPFIGHWSERVDLRYFAILAPLCTATVMSLLGLAPSLGVLIVMISLAGLSSASFHASAPVAIGRLSGSRLGLGLSIFSTTGEMARTVGPLIIVAAVSWWTITGTYRLIVLGVLASAVMFWRLRRCDFRSAHATTASLRDVVRIMRPLLVSLTIVLAARAFLLSALVTFLPTFLTFRGVDYRLAGASVAIVEFAGVLGALAGGPASDRFGRRAVLIVSFAIASAALLGFLFIEGWPMYILLVLGGFFGISTMPVVMALVQEKFPANRATANGIYMAMAFVFASLSSVSIGSMGDAWGLATAFAVCAIIGLLGVPLSIPLTRRREYEQV